MQNYKNLLEVIKKNDVEISYYLESVPVDQFKKDVLDISKINADKEMIKELIKNLENLL